MEVYGLTLFERILSGLMTGLGWLLIVLAVVTAVFSGTFGTAGFAGGMLVAATFITGAVLILGSSGIRQNRAAMELAYGLLIVIGVGWVVRGAWDLTVPALIFGVALVATFLLLAYVRNLALQARFNPRFMSLRQFETMVAIADAMIHGDGKEVLSPIQVAVNVDHALGRTEAPMAQDIRLILFVVEWLLPLRIARPFPFSAIGSNDRRRVVEKVIASKGLFRDVARFLKLLACIGYYSDEAAMRDVGFVPFEERARSEVDQRPLEFIDLLRAETR
jgi:hypothetical protein